MGSSAVTLLGTVLVIAAALGIAWPVFRSKTTQATADLLEHSLEITRNELAELEKRCQRETDELRGQIGALTGPFAREIATQVVVAIRDVLPR